MRSVLCAAAVLLAVPALAADEVSVRELDSKKAKVSRQELKGFSPMPIEITTADELALSDLFADGASRAWIKDQVDFAKEKVVVVRWWGSSSSYVKVTKCEKMVEFAVVTSSPTLTDYRFHGHVFVISRDAKVRSPWSKFLDEVKPDKAGLPETPCAADEPAVRLLKDVRPANSEGAGPPKPVVIKSADELAKSAAFADNVARDAVKKQVNFEKEKVIVFAWSGSGQDKISGALSKDGKIATFTYKAGLTDDLRRHAFAFAVPRDAEVKVAK